MRSSQNSPSRDCLESRRRVLDRLCVVLQEDEMGHFRPLLATRYTPNRGLLGLSRLSLEEEFYEVRRHGVLRSSRKAPSQLVGWWRTRSYFLPQASLLAPYG